MTSSQTPTFRRALPLLCMALALGACGSSQNFYPTAASVTGVTASTPAYGKATTFTISGINLPATVTPTVSGCTGLTIATDLSATSRQFTCTPEALSVGVSVNYSGAVPFTTSVAVARPQVTLSTSLGNIVVELYPENAPVTVKNFLGYVNSGFYANTIFHRVIAGFVSQGGGFVTDAGNTIAAKTNSTPPIALESNNGLKNLKYTLAMARTSVADSATSQFFFNAANNTSLDFSSAVSGANGYAVFGKAISGTATLDSMNAVATSTLSAGTFAGTADVPVTAVVLQSATQTQ